MLFDPFGYLRRFENVTDICKEFFEIRKKKYIERKSFQEGLLRAQSERLSNQVIFFLSFFRSYSIRVAISRIDVLLGLPDTSHECEVVGCCNLYLNL